jgi:hypothetical protein
MEYEAAIKIIRAECRRALTLDESARQGKHVVEEWSNPDAWVVRVPASGITDCVAEYGPLAKADADCHAHSRTFSPMAARLLLALLDKEDNEEAVIAAAKEIE